MKVYVLDDTCAIRVKSDVFSWMDCIFVVDKGNVNNAMKLLKQAWHKDWDKYGNYCYGDYLEETLQESHIRYKAFYVGK